MLLLPEVHGNFNLVTQGTFCRTIFTVEPPVIVTYGRQFMPTIVNDIDLPIRNASSVRLMGVKNRIFEPMIGTVMSTMYSDENVRTVS